MSDPCVRQGGVAVQMVASGADGETVVTVFPVAVVAQGVVDVHVYPADRVDEVDEAREIDLRVVVDLDAQHLAERPGQDSLPVAVVARELVGMPADERHQAIQLGVEVAQSSRQRNVDGVAGDGYHRDRLRDRIERCNDHRVSQGGIPRRAGIHAQQHDRGPALGDRRAGRGSRRGAAPRRQRRGVVEIREGAGDRRREDPSFLLADQARVGAKGGLRQHDEQREQADRKGVPGSQPGE